MKRLLLVAAIFAGLSASAFGQSSPPLRVREVDLSPNVLGVTTLVFSNGSVTCTGKTCTVTTGAGGGSPGGATGDYQVKSGSSFDGGVLSQTSAGRLVAASTLTASGVVPYLRVVTPVDTGQTADTEFPGIVFGGNASGATVTRTGADGTTLATQREYVFTAPTYAFAGATTVTAAATVAITAAPVAGANATLTDTYALSIQTGAQKFGTGSTAAGTYTLIDTPRTTAGSLQGMFRLQQQNTANNFDAYLLLANPIASPTSRLGLYGGAELTAGFDLYSSTYQTATDRQGQAVAIFGSTTRGFTVTDTSISSAYLRVVPSGVTLNRGNAYSGSTTPGAQLDVLSGAAARVVAIFDTAASPSANISEWKIDGTTAVSVTKDGEVKLRSVAFASLPAVANGALIYCSNCTLASPCASGGTGALAKGINSAWVCN